jgi:vitamin-K-epoxide reductase (warfarin-sensitive)
VTDRIQLLYRVITVLAIVGAVISTVALAHHYSKDPSSYCNFGQSFNCDFVNRSRYSEIMGIPVAVVGLAGYLLILTLATFYRHNADTPLLLSAAGIAGLAFSLYLTYIEARILTVWCVICLGSLFVIASISALSVWLAREPMKQES